MIGALEFRRPATCGDRKEVTDDAALVVGDLDAKVLFNAVATSSYTTGIAEV